MEQKPLIESKRNSGMDIIRCLALFTVLSVHFFLKNGFYDEPVLHKRMYIMTLMRSAFMICVPLFIVLSGYLMRNKKLEKGYYSKGLKTLWIYILASLACVFYRNVFLHQGYTVVSTLKGILAFNDAPYAWYIEMYAGLFFIIPFLNILYNNIETKGWKNVLIFTMLFLTSLPAVINVYNFNTPGWWVTPALSSNYMKIIPSWWNAIYPITYYLIGCYINEYGIKIKKSVNVLLILLTIIVSGTYNYWRSYGKQFISNSWNDWGSIFNVILTVLVFTFFVNLDYSRMPEKGKSFFRHISNLCLGGYLVSWIFDNTFYPILISKVPVMPYRLEYYFLIVPAVYACSLALSFVLNCIYRVLVGITHLIVKKTEKKLA